MDLLDSEFNEVCAKWTLSHFTKEGFTLKPREIKREINNRAKEWDVPVEQVAKAHKVLICFIFDKTMKELDQIISGKVEE